MTTPLDIINLAFKNAGILGVGQTLLAEDINDAFTQLNFMLSQWQRKRWMIWHLDTFSVQCTGALSYSVGPGGDIDIMRPDRLESAFFRQNIPSEPNQIDYPLEIIEARETYNQIALKSLGSFPSYIFYDSAFPLGYIYPWPLPSNLYQVFITVKAQLSQFATLIQDINLPPEYYACLTYNLAVRLRTFYDLPSNQRLDILAKDAINTIVGANTQIPRLRMPTDLIRPGIYNPYSDQIR